MKPDNKTDGNMMTKANCTASNCVLATVETSKPNPSEQTMNNIDSASNNVSLPLIGTIHGGRRMKIIPGIQPERVSTTTEREFTWKVLSDALMAHASPNNARFSCDVSIRHRH